MYTSFPLPCPQCSLAVGCSSVCICLAWQEVTTHLLLTTPHQVRHRRGKGEEAVVLLGKDRTMEGAVSPQTIQRGWGSSRGRPWCSGWTGEWLDWLTPQYLLHPRQLSRAAYSCPQLLSFCVFVCVGGSIFILPSKSPFQPCSFWCPACTHVKHSPY